ncbi:putative integral membrane protein (TIGR00698 family) [Aquamicrobium lusatiense]|uniref:Putative integral membrane protein (TIGR00698 family) n=1 Tax=Aquamicrobium lusatiense TaxID=89772 RepID=A0A7W9VXC5_9HYPH|nr:putative sulfate exporter family transporter [Aquamicrobium lusatiense]MBB6014042.1 putative integral membrane protein (TIGR00698 family) [Aquamicrobium lusatiense]
MSIAPAQGRLRSLPSAFGRVWPGVAVVVAVAIAAQFLSDHYGAPAMLMALLLGIAFHFLSEEGRCGPGIELCARTVLRLGVALLGMRISVELLLGLGAGTILLLVLAIAATVGFGLATARLLGRGWRLALLTSGAVAICGASAAMAIAAVLPKNEFSERNLIFTVLSVTVLSTVAMIFYPILAQSLGLDARATGIFFGGTIHDVAQVVGAGFSVSPEAGETATLVKLIRVTMLAPVVIVFALATRNVGQGVDMATGAAAGKPARPPLLPGFVLAFLALAALNSFGFVPEAVSGPASDLSRWALLAGIVAVGMKTSLGRVLEVGGDAVVLIVAETLFIGLFILTGIYYLGHV